MPTYTYRCTVCGFEKEVFHGILESPEMICRKCRRPMKRLVSGGSGVHFKGAGWYRKDNPYKNPKRKFKNLKNKPGKTVIKYNI